MARHCAVDVKDRREAVLSLLRREEPAAVIARRIGVSEPTLYRWRDEFLAAGEAALASGSGKKGVDPRDRRIAELQQQIEKRSSGDRGIHDRQPDFKKTFGSVRLSSESRAMITSELQVAASPPGARQTQVLRLLGVAPSSWHRAPREGDRRRPGPPPRCLDDEVVTAVVTMATANPWYGYKKIAIMCRRAGHAVKDREAYVVMRDHGLLQKPQPRRAELHQAAKLFELLPQGPNDLWQMDVTYIHIPGYGWWYAVTVIDYYSRYLLACHLTSSYSAAETAFALKLARAEAERIHGPLVKRPFLVTDNGPSFLARRFVAFVQAQFQHVRIQYRTPQQLGLLERFHATLKSEEVYWRLYDHPQHCRECLAEFRARYNERRPHWALAPEEGGDVLVPADVYVLGRTIQIPRWQAWARGAQAKLDKLMEEAA